VKSWINASKLSLSTLILSSGVYSPHAASAGTLKGKFKWKKTYRGEWGIIHRCPHLPTQRVQHGVKAGPGRCRPAAIHAPGIEHPRLSPGVVEGLELVPCCVMGRVRLPVPRRAGGIYSKSLKTLHTESFIWGADVLRWYSPSEGSVAYLPGLYDLQVPLSSAQELQSLWRPM